MGSPPPRKVRALSDRQKTSNECPMTPSESLVARVLGDELLKGSHPAAAVAVAALRCGVRRETAMDVFNRVAVRGL